MTPLKFARKPAYLCKLWTINRVLRWTGIRLCVAYADESLPDTDPGAWTRVGICFWGWSFIWRGEV